MQYEFRKNLLEMKKYSTKLFLAILFIFLSAVTSFATDVSVKDFGAKGDGKTDDRAALQAAVDAVKKAGGGTVSFPEGTYIVSAPNKGRWEPQVRICNNLKFKGAGMKRSIVKIMDNQGPYDVIFSGDSISGFTMVDMTVDANGETNPMITQKDSFSSPWLHTIIYLPDSRNIDIERCRFTNLSGIWAIYAQRRANNVVVDACIFDKIGGYTKNDWDHSTIRIDTDNGPVTVSNNVLTSKDGPATTGARTAMEIHGSNQKVINNKISGFRYGINVCTGGRGTGPNVSPTVNQQYIGNTITGVGSCFVFWSMSPAGFDGILFQDNTLVVDVPGWKDKYPNEIRGIFQTSRSTGPIRNLVIRHNKVSYLGPEGYGIANDVHAGMWLGNFPQSKTALSISNLTIADNTIINPTSSGIVLTATVDEAKISGNKIINPGKATGGLSEKYASGICLAGTMKNVVCENNMLTDDQAVNTMKTGIWEETINQGGCAASNNKIKVKSSSKFIPFHLNPNQTGTQWIVSNR